jgi:hypothetical protein
MECVNYLRDFSSSRRLHHNALGAVRDVLRSGEGRTMRPQATRYEHGYPVGHNNYKA